MSGKVLYPSDRIRIRRKRKLVWIDASLAIALFVYCVKLFPAVSVFFAKALSRPYRAAAGFLTSLVPFSVTEFLIIVAVVFGAVFLVSLFVLLAKKNRRKLVDKAFSLVLTVVFVFTLYSLTAQFDYERPEPEKPWMSAEMSEEDYRVMILKFAEDAGRLAAMLPKDENGYTVPPSFAETAKKMQKEIQKYAGGDYGYFVPLPKKVLNSWEMDLTNILGVTFAPTNEVNMNANISGLDLPYYMAHELAHALGIMSEREANIFAAFATLSSDEPYLRYSGYRALLGDLLSPIQSLDLPKDYDIEVRMREESIRLGLPEYPAGSDVSIEEWKWYFEQFKRIGGEESLNYVFGRGETEIAFRNALGEDFKKDAEIPYYTENIPEWMNGISEFFGEIGALFNDIYLKSSGLSDGTGSYDTGGSVVVPPSPDSGETDPTIIYGETVKIFLWIYQSRGGILS